MNNILIALCIGLAAGIMDSLPMFIQKMDRYACWAAFAHWVVLGLIIPFVDWEIQAWFKGLLIGELSAISVIIMVSKQGKKPIVPILVFSAILGVGVAVAGDYFIR